MNKPGEFPYPIPEFAAKYYWEACNRREFQMQRCTACARYRWMPGELCPYCDSADLVWTPLSGRGTVSTWTVVTHPVHPAAVAQVPYIVVEVEIEEQPGLRVISTLVEIDPEEITIGVPVEVEFREHSSGQKLPVFKPRR